MLSDEEKKAIERIEDVFYQDLGKGINKIQKITLYEDSITDIRTVLNLIEKQQKEIEEVKAISEYREKIIKGLGLKTLPKTITGFKQLIENNDKKWKDKIKAKIQEVDYKMIAHQDVREAVKSILQSLLEKE